MSFNNSCFALQTRISILRVANAEEDVCLWRLVIDAGIKKTASKYGAVFLF